MAVNSLRQRLREQTHPLHIKVDSHPLMRTLCSPELTRDVYTVVLRAMDEALSQLEPLLAVAPWSPDVVPPPPFTPRRVALQRDLLTLSANGAPAGEPGGAPLSLETYVGVRYVLDGARMGGLVLAKHVGRLLGTQVPTEFFRGEGERTGPSWAAFTAWADAAGTHLDFPVAACAAEQSFQVFLQSFDSARLEISLPLPQLSGHK